MFVCFLSLSLVCSSFCSYFLSCDSSSLVSIFFSFCLFFFCSSSSSSFASSSFSSSFASSSFYFFFFFCFFFFCFFFGSSSFKILLKLQESSLWGGVFAKDQMDNKKRKGQRGSLIFAFPLSSSSSSTFSKPSSAPSC